MSIQKSTKRLTTFEEVTREINKLIDAVNSPEQSAGNGSIGKNGDTRFVVDDGYPYWEMRGERGWYTTVQGMITDKPGQGRPYPHFAYLEVDNLFAQQFTVRQTSGSNGETLFSDMGVVESVGLNTITFKDQTNLNICPFSVNDKIITRVTKADGSLDIRYIKATVNSVSGRTATITYTSSAKFEIGDTVVRVGNSSNANRQGSIYISTSLSNAPYLDVYDDIEDFTGVGKKYWDNHIPTLRIGKLTGITDIDFGGALTGSGLYAENVYLKGKLKISSNADIIGLTPTLATYTMADTFPGSPVEGDWHFYTKDPPVAPYKTNTWYRFDGANWQSMGLVGTYIDGTGLYTGTIVANKIIAGTLTGFTLQSNADPATNGGFKFDTPGNKLTLYGSPGTTAGLELYTSTLPLIHFYRTDVGANVSLSITNSTGIGQAIHSSEGLSAKKIAISEELYIAGGFFKVNASGDISKWGNYSVNSPSAGYLRCNGSSIVWDTPSLSETDPIFTAWSYKATVESNASNWNTAYGWGNHASVGYLTSSTESWRAGLVTSVGTGLTIASNVLKVNAGYFGTGLAESSGQIVVNYDSSSLEISTALLKVKGGFGESSSSDLFVATSSGGAVTKNLDYVPLTINGVTFNVLLKT